MNNEEKKAPNLIKKIKASWDKKQQEKIDRFEHHSSQESSKDEIVLKVKNLRQYFTMGVGRNKVVIKAVHNVNFEIKRGEVFGLVGESGCGKTTTGRSIIKLYDITDGEVFFNGVRTSVGTRSYKQKIVDALEDIKIRKIETRKRIRALSNNVAEETLDEAGDEVVNVDFDELDDLKTIEELQKNLTEFIAEKRQVIADLKEEIKKAKRDNVRDPKIMNKMQMIFQDPIDSLNPRMTVQEIIAEGMYINGIHNKEYVDKKVKEALRLVGLVEEHAGRYPHEFSGGQRQRIGIARALVTNPDLIIADEPISALDVSIQAQVINLLNDLRNQFNLTILFIAHNLSVVKFFCDRIGVMYYGRLVEVASAEELFLHPLHPYTKSLLSAVPLPDPDYEKSRKRIFYNPQLREHTVDKPVLTEIRPGHFVYAAKKELERYERELNGEVVEPDPTLITNKE